MKSLRKIAFLSSLYFVQGLPFGFRANALPNHLRASGVSLTGIGLARALADWDVRHVAGFDAAK